MKTNSEVDEFLLKKDHPLISEIQRVREIILTTDPRIRETIKWGMPTFMYNGIIASILINTKKFVSLMFRYGAYIEDKNGLLNGEGKISRTARFMDLEDIESKKPALQELVREWIRMQDEEDEDLEEEWDEDNEDDDLDYDW